MWPEKINLLQDDLAKTLEVIFSARSYAKKSLWVSQQWTVYLQSNNNTQI